MPQLRSATAPHTTSLPKPAIFSWRALLQLIRWPNLFIVALTQYLGAIFLIGPAENWLAYLSSPLQFTLCSATIFITAGGYLINDYYDNKIDFLNRPDQVVVGTRMKRRSVMVLHLIFSLAGVFLGFLLSPLIGLICLGAACWLWLYSAQLKRLPLIGNLSVAILTALTLIMLTLYYQRAELLVYTFALFAGAITLVREIVKDMEDMYGDAAFGCRTLPIVLGLRATKGLLYLVIAVLIGMQLSMAINLQQPIAKIFFFLLVIPTGFWVLALAKADTRQAYRRLSLYCKLFMLGGVLSMLFF